MDIFRILLIEPLANGLAVFYKLFGGNMGVAIIAFSLFLRLLLTPLTKPYMESMKKMKQHSKDLDKLKKRHKDDKAKLMKAQADFYKEKGINPGSGCLPYLLQIIILIALFRVFTGILVSNGDVTSKFNEMLYDSVKFSSDTVINTKFLYLDVTKPDVIRLPGLPFPIPGPFIILSALTQFLSAKMTAPYVKEEQKKAKKTKSDIDDFQVAMQSSMIYTFPIMTLLIGISFPSGLAIYWFLFSLYQAVQQFRSTGWGGLTPWIERINLLKSA